MGSNHQHTDSKSVVLPIELTPNIVSTKTQAVVVHYSGIPALGRIAEPPTCHPTASCVYEETTFRLFLTSNDIKQQLIFLSYFMPE